VHLNQKVRIYPTEEQLEVLWDLSEKCRLIYNFALSERIENWKEQKEKPKKERKYITYTHQQNKLLEIKRKYPEASITDYIFIFITDLQQLFL
jgi:putative transposase